jgi:acetyl-CoA acetyltransferase
MREEVIASAARTAIGACGGALREVPAVELGGIVIKEVLHRAKISQDKVDLVILGNVLQAGEGQNPSRQAAMLADISQYTPARTINAVCGSGMEAVITATQKIQVRAADIIVAGGMESMSNAPFILPRARLQNLIDIATHLGLEQIHIEIPPVLDKAFYLFEKMGFKEVAKLQGFVKDLEGNESDLVLMVKYLQ